MFATPGSARSGASFRSMGRRISEVLSTGSVTVQLVVYQTDDALERLAYNADAHQNFWVNAEGSFGRATGLIER